VRLLRYLRRLSSWYWFLLQFHVGLKWLLLWLGKRYCRLFGHHWEQMYERDGERWLLCDHYHCERCWSSRITPVATPPPPAPPPAAARR
jgi:hypothetical protein